MKLFYKHSALLSVACGAALVFACSSKDETPAPKSAAGSSAGGSAGKGGGSGGSGAGDTAGSDNAGADTGGSSGANGATGGSTSGSAGSGGSGQGGSAGKGGGSNGGKGGSSQSGSGGSGNDGGAPPAFDCGEEGEPTAAPPELTPGEWVNISPPGTYRPTGEVPPYGVLDVKISPCNPYILYATTDIMGMWRSTDGGSSWAEISDLPAPISPGTMQINPRDPNHMYTVGGVRGSSLGFWVSKDGGDHWVMPQGFLEKANNAVGGWTNDVYDVKPDPKDFNHVLLTFHSPFEFKEDAGVLESKDGGETWVRHDVGEPVGAGHTIWFMNDSDTWLLGTQTHGYYRTTDAGETWKQVSTQDMLHGGTSIYLAKTGILYIGANNRMLRSSDWGETFELVAPQTQDGYYAIQGDGNFMYTARANTGSSTGPEDGYLVSEETDGVNWVPYNDQKFRDGPYRMSFDAKNRIIYSANFNTGVWALKVKAP